MLQVVQCIANQKEGYFDENSYLRLGFNLVYDNYLNKWEVLTSIFQKRNFNIN